MSRANILRMVPSDDGTLLITFQVHRPPGTRTYVYDPVSAVQILAGSDPAKFAGELVRED